MSTLSRDTLTSLCVAGFRSARGDRVSRAAVGTVYVGLLVILSGLYRVTPFEDLGKETPFSYDSVVWYMMLTELIAMSVWVQYREVREDILSHRISGLLILPLGYLPMKLAEWLGRTLGAMAELLVIGTVVAFLLTGTVGLPLAFLPFLGLSLVLSVMIFNTLHLCIGLTEVWGAHSRPVFLIVQKLLFLFGGLLIPITIYPGWMQSVAWATPLPSILFAPGSFAFAPETFEIARLLVMQAFWLAMSLVVAGFVHTAARRHIGRYGD